MLPRFLQQISWSDMNWSYQKFCFDRLTRHSTCLKNKLLAQIPNLQYSNKGKQRFMAFNSKITELLHKDIEKKTDLETNKILLKYMFSGEWALFKWISQRSLCAA